jgi:hypothetical protein
MKKGILFCLVLAVTALMNAQSITLPGIGSNEVSVSNSLLNTSTQLTFGNPEYNVVNFTIAFPVTGNPGYSATAAGSHLTNDMVSSLAQRVPGSNINLQISLQAPGSGVAPWNKSYVLSIAD